MAKKNILRAIMERERKYASPKEIEDHLKQLDVKKLCKGLEDFAFFTLYEKDRELASSIVNQAFDKFFCQDRKWYEGENFDRTLFGAIKSLSNNENKKQLKKWENLKTGVDFDSLSDSAYQNPEKELEVRELMQLAIDDLKNHKPPPSKLEVEIFECFIEGLTKPQDIAEYLSTRIEDIQNAIKRLSRKLVPIQEKFLKMGYEKK